MLGFTSSGTEAVVALPPSSELSFWILLKIRFSPLSVSRGPGSKADIGNADSPLAVSRGAGFHTCCWVYTRRRQNIRMQWFQIWPIESFLKPLEYNNCEF